MKNKILRSASLCLVAMLGAATFQVRAGIESSPYFAAVRTDPPPMIGQNYYLRHCIMEENGVQSATNYWRGNLVPINTRVTLVSLGGESLVLRVLGGGETVKVRNVPNFTRCSIQAIAARMLSPTPISLDKFPPEMANAIKNGMMKIGMTKEQVVMARGYPPAHKTPSLDGDTWKYWPSRFVVQTVVFRDGVLVRGRGIN